MKIRVLGMSLLAMALIPFFAQCNKPTIGIDISRHNNKIDWDAPELQDVEFCYIKLTQGDWRIDPMAGKHAENARKKGMKVGFYHYYGTSSTGEEQFEVFKAQLAKHSMDLIPVIDVESLDNDFSDKKKIRRDVSVIIERFKEEYGYYPIVYFGNIPAYIVWPLSHKCKKWYRTVGVPKFLQKKGFQQTEVKLVNGQRTDFDICSDLSSLMLPSDVTQED